MADYVPGSFMNTSGYNSGQVHKPSPKSVPYWDANGKMHYPPAPIASSRYGSFMNTPGYNMGHAESALGKFDIVLPCTPDLPSGFVGTPGGEKLTTLKTGGGGGDTKTATTANFLDNVFVALPDYAIEEALSLIGLTANQLLEVSHRENFYTDSSVLNSNIVDLVDTLNTISPTEIIKLQDPNVSYFKNNLYAYSSSVETSNAIVTITIPVSEIESSYKIEVENFAPKYIKNDTIYA